MNKDAFKKFELTGKTALVTGGGAGLGYNVTRALVHSGAKVMIAARRGHVLADAAKKLMEETPGSEVLWHVFDLSKRDTISDLASHAIKTMGGVDIYVGNAAQDFHQP